VVLGRRPTVFEADILTSVTQQPVAHPCSTRTRQGIAAAHWEALAAGIAIAGGLQGGVYHRTLLPNIVAALAQIAGWCAALFDAESQASMASMLCGALRSLMVQHSQVRRLSNSRHIRLSAVHMCSRWRAALPKYSIQYCLAAAMLCSPPSWVLLCLMLLEGI